MPIDDNSIFVDGFDYAIIGSTDDNRIVYSKVMMVGELVSTEGMSVEDAIEHCEYNIWFAYIGEKTPIYINDFDSDIYELEQRNNA